MYDYEEKPPVVPFWVTMTVCTIISLLIAIIFIAPIIRTHSQQIEVQQAQITVLEDKIKHLPKNTVIMIQDGQVTDQYDVDSDEAKPEDDDTDQPCDQPKVNY